MSTLQIVAPAAGRLLGWVLSGVPVVTAGALLGEVEDAGGKVHELRAPAAGRFWPLTKRGELVTAGEPLATLDAKGSEGMPTGPSEAKIVQSPSRPPQRSPAPPVAIPVAREAPIVEELTLDPPSNAPGGATRGAGVSSPSLSASRGSGGNVARQKTRNRTYSMAVHQEDELKRIVHRLALEGGPAVNESELVRAAVAMLLALHRPALLDVIEANKARERAGAYGVGRPRPGRGKR